MERFFSRTQAALVTALIAGAFCLISAPLPASAAPQSTAQQADNRFSHHDYQEAADLYLRAAGEADSASRSGLLVQAADSAMRADRRDLALQTLAKVDDSQLTTGQRMLASLLRVELGQLADDPVEVLRRLPPPPADIDRDVAARIWSVRADAYLRYGDPIEGIRALVRRETFLKNSTEARRNQSRIWQTLRASPAVGTQFQHRTDLDSVTLGWLELALIDRAIWTDPKDREQSINKWEDRFPRHPARGDVLDMMRKNQPVIAAKPKPPAPPPKPKPELKPEPVIEAQAPSAAAAAVISRPAIAEQGSSIPASGLPELRNARSVALILPLTGSLSLPAKAVRDGFLAAYYELPEPRPRVQVLDSGASAEDAFAVYERAIEGGADLIVGPLAKEAVATLARMSNPRNPVLALNYLDPGENAPDHFYQFGLSPEDEAQQVAERAIADGYRKAIALVPEGDWGTRTLAAFRQRFETLGGTIQRTETFTGRSQDYSQAVARLLKVAPAPANKPDERPMFQPGPGNDPDFAFIAAQPQQARQIRPQFRFLGAGKLPMYATSHIYEGFPSASRDEDLNAIMFCDMPWILGSGDVAAARDRVRTLWPDSYTRYPRLYAFGYDAAHLLGVISGKSGGNDSLSATGRLRIDSQNRVHRTLLWARFENGIPKLIADTTAGP